MTETWEEKSTPEVYEALLFFGGRGASLFLSLVSSPPGGLLLAPCSLLLLLALCSLLPAPCSLLPAPCSQLLLLILLLLLFLLCSCSWSFSCSCSCSCSCLENKIRPLTCSRLYIGWWWLKYFFFKFVCAWVFWPPLTSWFPRLFDPLPRLFDQPPPGFFLSPRSSITTSGQRKKPYDVIPQINRYFVQTNR